MLGTHEYQHVHSQIATLFSLWASCIFRLDFCNSPEMLRPEIASACTLR